MRVGGSLKWITVCQLLFKDVLAVKSMGAPSESKEKQVQQQKVQVESQNVDIGRRIQKEPVKFLRTVFSEVYY